MNISAPFYPEDNSSEALEEHVVGIFENNLLEYVYDHLPDAALEYVLEYVEEMEGLEDDACIARAEALLDDPAWAQGFFRHHVGFFEDVKDYEESRRDEV